MAAVKPSLTSDLQKLLHRLQSRDRLSELAGQKLVKQLVHGKRWMFQALALIAHGSTCGTGVEFEQVTDELVRMLHPYFMTSQDLFREVFEVVGDDDARLAVEGSRQYMAVVGIRKLEIVDQAFVRVHKAVGYCLVHQLAGSLELRLGQVLALLKNSADPFIVDALCPTRAEKISESQAKEKIAY